VVKNQRTGQPYTNADAARLSAGDLSEEEVAGIRSRRIPDPTVSHVAALGDVIGVPPSLYLNREEKPVLDDTETEAGAAIRGSNSGRGKRPRSGDPDKPRRRPAPPQPPLLRAGQYFHLSADQLVSIAASRHFRSSVLDHSPNNLRPSASGECAPPSRVAERVRLRYQVTSAAILLRG